MNDILDMHTHTIASGHAYNTIREMALAAKAKGLEILGIAEHAPNMPGTCHPFYFYNLEVIDRTAYGIELFLGAELNILDEHGTVDLPEELLERIDYCIASFHEMCCPPTTKEQNTRALINAMKNPHVNIIGHPDNANFALDYEAVVLAAKKYNVLLEINNSSMRPNSNRPGAWENNRTMLKLCQQHGVSVILDSDAHSEMGVGNHQYAWQLIEELNFPTQLIVNDSREKLLRFLKKRT